MALEGTIEDFAWLGTHTFRLRSTLGRYDPSPDARGQYGFFETIFSDPILLTINDPCLFSIVNADGALSITDVKVPDGKTSLYLTYKGPTDSISATYGNGYDKCGSLTYKYLHPDLKSTFVFD